MRSLTVVHAKAQLEAMLRRGMNEPFKECDESLAW